MKTKAVILLVALTLSAALPGAAQDPSRPLRLPHGGEVAGILPEGGDHPLQGRIRTFLGRMAGIKAFQGTGLSREDYLRVVARQVAVFRRHQDEKGRIIDPIEKREYQYATPCYALSVALLQWSGFDSDETLLESGIRAMDSAVDQMHAGAAADNHGDFYTWPVMLAYDVYEPLVPRPKHAEWRGELSGVDPYKLYRASLTEKRTETHNWNVVALCGEYLRAARRLTTLEYTEKHLAHQKKRFTDLGMYVDPGAPLAYDHFPRHFLAAMLCEGYKGDHFAAYRDLLWKGAWTSLFMMSPTGEAPTGYRSSHHIWNEAQSAVTFEIYAHQYARAGRFAEAGAFKRAARLSLECVRRWIRPDGSGYVVKNRYPTRNRHGYEGYSSHSQYNLLACSMLALAYVLADESVPERPCPADVGGFAVPIPENFHKIFANAGGTYVEYDTDGDHRYNPTGLIRIHVKGSSPQLGPSDGTVAQREAKTGKLIRGENLCVGPAWQEPSGTWRRLADLDPSPPKVEILEEEPHLVRFRVTYEQGLLGLERLTEMISVDPEGVTVEDEVIGKGVKKVRIYYPMLVFDGAEETHVDLGSESLDLRHRGRGIRFRIIRPGVSELKRGGQRLEHRNGLVEAVYAEGEATRPVYRVEYLAPPDEVK